MTHLLIKVGDIFAYLLFYLNFLKLNNVSMIASAVYIVKQMSNFGQGCTALIRRIGGFSVPSSLQVLYVYKKLQELMTKYQSPFRLWLGPQIYFVLHDAEHIKEILLDPNALGKPSHYDMMKPLLRAGLVTAQVPKWKLHRKAIEPLFGRKVLESYVQRITRHALLEVKRIGMENPGREFDVNHYMLRYVFNTIMDTSMGGQVNSITSKDCTFFDVVTSAIEITSQRFLKPWLHPDFIFNFTSLGRTLRKNIEYIDEFARNALETVKSDIIKQIESRPRECLLGLLLTSAEGDYKFTDEEIYDEIITVIGAGYETSASLLQEIIFILANYPNIQDKVYAEVRDIYGESNFESLDITLQDIDRLEYLTRLIKETLRFFPTVPMVLRYLSREVNIGEYTLPAASSVMINITQNHRNEKYWPKPLEFNPDRFLPNHPLGPRHPYAYTPFSAGMRNCIGRKYALLSVKILLIILTSRYIIKTRIAQEVTDLELKMSLTLKTKDPIMISIERRCPEIS